MRGMRQDSGHPRVGYLLGGTQRLRPRETQRFTIVAALEDRDRHGAQVGGIDERDRHVGERVADAARWFSPDPPVSASCLWCLACCVVDPKATSESGTRRFA
jgi:hypothetical protein